MQHGLKLCKLRQIRRESHEVPRALRCLVIGFDCAVEKTRLRFKGDERQRGKSTFRLVPDHLLTELVIGVGLLVVLSAFAVIFPAGLAERADPLTTPSHIKPEWYYYFTFRWLKLSGLRTAVLTLGLAAALFVAWPLVDGYLRRFTKRDLSIPLGIVAVLAILALTLWEALAH